MIEILNMFFLIISMIWICSFPLIQNNSKINLDNSSMKENSDDKIILEDKKNPSPQHSQSSEEI